MDKGRVEANVGGHIEFDLKQIVSELETFVRITDQIKQTVNFPHRPVFL